MTPKKDGNGNGRATIRDVLTAVQGLHGRIDDTHRRIDGLAKEQAETGRRMVALKEVVNDRIHMIEVDVTALRRPWVFIRSGWTKAGAAAAFASMTTGLLVRFAEFPWSF